MSYRVLLLIVGIVCCFVLFSVAVGCDISGPEDDSGNSDDSNGDSDDSDDSEDEWADLQIFYDNDSAKDITGVGFANGAGPFTVPSPDDWGDGDCDGAFIEITIENTSGDAAEGTNLYLWHDEVQGSNDLTDVTITADIRYWLWNVV